MRGNMRAEVSLSCLLPAFRIRLSQRTRIRRFDRPACLHGPTAHRPVRGSSVHSCSCYVLQTMALASQTEANGSHQRSSTCPLALTFVEQAGKIAEHGLSRPANLEIRTRSERWANL